MPPQGGTTSGGRFLSLREKGYLMSKVKVGDKVRVQYLGLLSGGRPMAGMRGRQVLAFTVGSEEVLPGISKGVVGMAIGDQKRLTLSADEAFGPVDRKLVKEIPRKRFAPNLELYVGKQLQTTGAKSGRKRRVKVVEMRPETVVVDANHPMAGEAVEVELQLISLRASNGKA
jgi:peptidylprolyl isomerase